MSDFGLGDRMTLEDDVHAALKWHGFMDPQTERMDFPMGDLVKLGGLWLKRDKNQKQFMSGRLAEDALESLDENTELFVFRNHKKPAGSNQPDYELFGSPPPQAAPAKTTGGTAAGQTVEEDSIPF